MNIEITSGGAFAVCATLFGAYLGKRLAENRHLGGPSGMLEWEQGFGGLLGGLAGFGAAAITRNVFGF